MISVWVWDLNGILFDIIFKLLSISQMHLGHYFLEYLLYSSFVFSQFCSLHLVPLVNHLHYLCGFHTTSCISLACLNLLFTELYSGSLFLKTGFLNWNLQTPGGSMRELQANKWNKQFKKNQMKPLLQLHVM